MLLLAAALLGAGALARAQATGTEPCVEPVPEAASATPPLPRLRELTYRCLRLRNGQRVLVGEAGSAYARTVLLVHGLGNNAHRDWARMVRPLAAQFHVVTVDLPGFGASPPAPDGYAFASLGRMLSDVIDQTAPGQRVHVVGHSLGGAVSLYFAHAHAAQVDRLVLVDAAGILLKTVFVQHISGVRTPQVGVAPVDRFLKGLGERIAGMKRGVFNNLMDDRFDFSRWLAQNPGVRYALLGRYTQIEAGLGLVEHDFTKAIRETTAPTTVIWGGDDPIAPPRTGRLLAARLPDARLKVMEGVGHTPMLESPDAFRALLLEALAAPLAPREPTIVATASQGDVVCRGEAGKVYTGRFDSLTLDNCPGARLSQARLKQLVLQSTDVVIDDTQIESDDVGLTAHDSQVTATNLRVDARVALRTANSRLDLAGASLRARDRVVDMLSFSRLLLSVSDWRGVDVAGDAHFLWPQAGPGSANGASGVVGTTGEAPRMPPR